MYNNSSNNNSTYQDQNYNNPSNYQNNNNSGQIQNYSSENSQQNIPHHQPQQQVRQRKSQQSHQQQPQQQQYQDQQINFNNNFGNNQNQVNNNNNQRMQQQPQRNGDQQQNYNNSQYNSNNNSNMQNQNYQHQKNSYNNNNYTQQQYQDDINNNYDNYVDPQQQQQQQQNYSSSNNSYQNNNNNSRGNMNTTSYQQQQNNAHQMQNNNDIQNNNNNQYEQSQIYQQQDMQLHQQNSYQSQQNNNNNTMQQSNLSQVQQKENVKPTELKTVSLHINGVEIKEFKIQTKIHYGKKQFVYELSQTITSQQMNPNNPAEMQTVSMKDNRKIEIKFQDIEKVEIMPQNNSMTVVTRIPPRELKDHNTQSRKNSQWLDHNFLAEMIGIQITKSSQITLTSIHQKDQLTKSGQGKVSNLDKIKSQPITNLYVNGEYINTHDFSLKLQQQQFEQQQQQQMQQGQMNIQQGFNNNYSQNYTSYEDIQQNQNPYMDMPTNSINTNGNIPDNSYSIGNMDNNNNNNMAPQQQQQFQQQQQQQQGQQQQQQQGMNYQNQFQIPNNTSHQGGMISQKITKKLTKKMQQQMQKQEEGNFYLNDPNNNINNNVNGQQQQQTAPLTKKQSQVTKKQIQKQQQQQQYLLEKQQQIAKIEEQLELGFQEESVENSLEQSTKISNVDIEDDDGFSYLNQQNIKELEQFMKQLNKMSEDQKLKEIKDKQNIKKFPLDYHTKQSRCPYYKCQRTFKNHLQLNKHMKKHHSDLVELGFEQNQQLQFKWNESALNYVLLMTKTYPKLVLNILNNMKKAQLDHGTGQKN